MKEVLDVTMTTTLLASFHLIGEWPTLSSAIFSPLNHFLLFYGLIVVEMAVIAHVPRPPSVFYLRKLLSLVVQHGFAPDLRLCFCSSELTGFGTLHHCF